MIRDWLLANGWGSDQIFLDIDNLVTGDRWRNRLNEIGGNCEAVIACISDDWLKSPECLREFNHAESRGKPIFPLQIEEINIKIPGFIMDLQITNISSENKSDGLSKLESSLVSARIGPKYFKWPPFDDPNRSPYRGLQPLEEMDAAVFFGRDVAITKGLDQLRKMRQGQNGGILVVLGASGSGKSSFLRAGVLARLRRDKENFYILEILRPENDALEGNHGLLSSLKGYKKIDLSIIDSIEHRPPTYVLPIDQGEELFSPDNIQGKAALDDICKKLKDDPNLIVVITIRSDSYDRLQHTLNEYGIEPVLFNLPAISPTAYKDIVTQPGLLVEPNIEVEEALVEKLVEDLSGQNALPLLAFTLQQLVEKFGDDNKLELNEYTVGLKGLTGAVNSAFNAAFEAAQKDSLLPDEMMDIENLARKTFIPQLVQMDASSMIPKRRRCLRKNLSKESNQLLNHLINQRLLLVDTSSNTKSKEVFVEVAHEAVLRFWPLLTNWLENEASNLILKDKISAATNEWLSNDRSSDWLIHYGSRLASAMNLISNEIYSNDISTDMKDYLKACELNQPENDADAYKVRMDLIKNKMGQDIFDKLERNEELTKNPSHMSTGFLDESENELQVKKNSFADIPMWHPSPPNLVGDTGYFDVWKFPCCGSIHQTSGGPPSQDRADGCKPKK